MGKDGVGLGDCAIAESRLEKGENISSRMLALIPSMGEIRQKGTRDIEFAINGLLARRSSHAQIGAVSAPICAVCHRPLGGSSIVSVQPCPLFSDSGSKVGQTRCARTHSNSVSSSIAPEATARPTSTTSSFVQSSRIPLTSRAELIYD